jgi:hypothetical protein
MIDDEAKAQVARVVAYAMEHIYTPGKDPVPGDNPNFVANLDTFTCVFTFTRIEGGIYRHLTISVPVAGKFPNPVAAFMIAEMFGFTGYDENDPFTPGDGWMCDTKKDENCVMIAQEAK